jgi:hypothetical protein
MWVFLVVRLRQAIGTEVAAETNSKAVTNAPANRVAVWRTEAIELNMALIPFFKFVREPDHRATPPSMQGACQLGILYVFQWITLVVREKYRRGAP